jgi:cell division protein ZapA
MADRDSLVHVEIFGQDYAVRGGEDPKYVESLAAFVDAQMKEVSRTSGAVDSLRIAVLAALNIADERFRLREEIGEAETRARKAGESAEDRAARLARQLEAVLGE